MKKILTLCLIFINVIFFSEVFGAKKKKVSAINTGTKVHAKIEAKGLYDQECYDMYYGCMDQFCVPDNSSGGSCACSDDNKNFEADLERVKNTLMEAKRISTIEVEKIEAGAKADIIFGDGKRKYDDKGNVIELGQKNSSTDSLSSLFVDNEEEEEDDEEESEFAVASDATGNALKSQASKYCKTKISAKCSKDLSFLTQLYGRQIVADCKAFENEVKKQKLLADEELAKAEKSVRDAKTAQLKKVNKFDRGTCMVEYKKCMMGPDACGSRWENCVDVVGLENIVDDASSLDTASALKISNSTMKILNNKRFICEKILDQCVAVREKVWDDFLADVAPTLKIAELDIESEKRMNCLGNATNCLLKACKDNISGTEGMDSCLADPSLVKSFCKREIELCEAVNPNTWTYIVSRLASMRVDACTKEVESCIKDPNYGCGEDLLGCTGTDFEFVKNMCPIDKLLVCKQNRKDFKMDDVINIVQGFFLNMDNTLLKTCQKLVNDKMVEVCGSTTDCNAFAANDTLGTRSLQIQKLNGFYRISGLISLGSINIGTGNAIDRKIGGAEVKNLSSGELAIEEYLNKIKNAEVNQGVEESSVIISQIEEELNNIKGTINKTLQIIEQDIKIQQCISGRDLSQVTGIKGQKTEGRYPNLLNQIKYQIAMSALKQAEKNYNTKLQNLISKGTKEADADMANYMCNMMAHTGETTELKNSTNLQKPYALVYDIGQGVDIRDMPSSTSNTSKNSSSSNSYSSNSANGGYNLTKTALFSRDTRICKICESGTVDDCKVTGSSSWFHNNKKSVCNAKAIPETCHEVQM